MSSLFVGEHPTHMTVVVVQGSTADLVVPADTGVLAAPVLEFTANRAGEPSVTHALALESGEWVVHLSSVQVAALAGLHFARVKDSGRVVAAGQVQHNPGWYGRSESQVVTTRLVWGGGAGGGGGDGADPLAALTTLPASPVAWLPYQFRITATTSLPSGITWATGAPVIGGWGIAVLIWDGTTWRGEWAEMTGGGSTPPGGAVTPMEPTFTDPSGTDSDRYTIPSQTGVEYRKAGALISAGTYTPTAGETVTITAQAATGYTLTSGATASWTHTFSTVVANTAPSMTLGTPTITGLEVTQPFTTSDVDGDTVTVTAAWGDGATGTVTSPAVHTYATAGAYSATFTPNDGTADGAVRNQQYTVASGPPPVGDPATLQDALIAYGAAGYWKLNESSGTTITDHSGNGRHGTLAGTAGTDYDLASGTPAILNLKTNLGKVQIPHHASFGLAVTIFAVASYTNTGNLITKGVPEATQREWVITASSQRLLAGVLRSNSSSTRLLESLTNVGTFLGGNTGIAAAIRHESTGTHPTVWIGSGAAQTVTTAGNTGTSGTGGTVEIGGGFRGRIGHVAIIPGLLTDAHIQKLMDLARAEGLIA